MPSDGVIYKLVAPFVFEYFFDMKIDARHCNEYSGTGSKDFSIKKYVAISQRAGAHAGERISLLSTIRRSHRQNSARCLRSDSGT